MIFVISRSLPRDISVRYWYMLLRGGFLVKNSLMLLSIFEFNINVRAKSGFSDCPNYVDPLGEPSAQNTFENESYKFIFAGFRV